MTPLIIPLFIIHQGCPHRCVFCDQKNITGRNSPEESSIGAKEAREEINTWLARPRKNPNRPVEVAFYGGSFTGLPRKHQDDLLGAVRPFLLKKKVQGIRLSTRPDQVDPEVAEYLINHGVQTVELGVQSMDDAVLKACDRGYKSNKVETAFDVLKRAGLRTGGQLMIGLPGETTVGTLAGAKRLAGLKPDCVRIYPTLVLRESALARLYIGGSYRPLSLNKAVALAARVKDIFDRSGIPVIRMGLQAGKSLEENLVAGPYHPSFGELVLSRLLFQKTRRMLSLARRGNGVEQGSQLLSIATPDRSLFHGPSKVSLKRLKALGLLDRVKTVLRPEQARHTVTLSAVSESPE